MRGAGGHLLAHWLTRYNARRLPNVDLTASVICGDQNRPMCRLLQCLLRIKIPVVLLPARKTRGIETPAAETWFPCPGQAVLGQGRRRFGDLV